MDFNEISSIQYKCEGREVDKISVHGTYKSVDQKIKYNDTYFKWRE